MIKKDHDEIWYWHLKVEEFKKLGMGQKEYCDAHELDYKRFCNMYYRIDYKRSRDPELYAKLVATTRKYLSSGAPASKFARANDIHPRILSETVTHLGYIDIIESMKKSKEEKPMQFIHVPVVNLPYIPPKEQEVVEKQNDLEIIIAKGVKVSISPNIDSMKIIKIIEFLKDL